MIEIEVKARCDPKRVKEILGSPMKIVYEEDYYFNHPCRDFSKTDEAFRIRISRDGENERMEITYKGPKIDSISKSREEITIDIREKIDFNSVKKMFSQLGFKDVGVVIKRREIYQKDVAKVYLDYVEGYVAKRKISLGWFVEVEVTQGEYSQDAVKDVLDILKSLTESPPIRESYLELLLKSYSY